MHARLRRFTKNLPYPQLPVLGLLYPQAQIFHVAINTLQPRLPTSTPTYFSNYLHFCALLNPVVICFPLHMLNHLNLPSLTISVTASILTRFLSSSDVILFFRVTPHIP